MNRWSPTINQLERPRRLAEREGVASLADDQLLALLLGHGTNGRNALALSRMLLEKVGDACRLGKLGPGGLGHLEGLGRKQALRIAAAMELGRRAERQAYRDPPRLPLTARRVAEWAIPRLGALEHEEVWVLCVDARTTLKSTWRVGRGGAHGCALVPRDLLIPVVREGAAGFILVHNHPSGDPSPSREDLELTSAVYRAGHALATPLLDHVIVARREYRSLLEDGHFAVKTSDSVI